MTSQDAAWLLTDLIEKLLIGHTDGNARYVRARVAELLAVLLGERHGDAA